MRVTRTLDPCPGRCHGVSSVSATAGTAAGVRRRVHQLIVNVVALTTSTNPAASS